MSRSRREDQRLLSKDEHELVERTRQPAMKSLGSGELTSLISQLRSRRDRARDLVKRQRREIRGKATTDGSGTASDGANLSAKGDLLAAALKRANKERSRRRRDEATGDQVAYAERALEMKRQSEDDQPSWPQSRTADEGMNPIPNEGIAPSGAFEQEGHRPVLERSRKVR